MYMFHNFNCRCILMDTQYNMCHKRIITVSNSLLYKDLIDLVVIFYFFFFSSRRRHTRLQGDWSSDVCSSDLSAPPVTSASAALLAVLTSNLPALTERLPSMTLLSPLNVVVPMPVWLTLPMQIGRASCRERV